MRTTTLVFSAALLAACDTDVLSPTRVTSADAAARAGAGPPGAALSTRVMSANYIILNWQDNSKNEDGWEVHRSTTGANGPFTLHASLPANTADYGDQGLAPQTQYCYKVRSFRRAANTTFAAFTSVACATTSGPTAPSGTSAVPGSSTLVDVTWIDNATNETTLRVERSPNPSGPWAVAATLGANQSTFADGNRATEQQVCYRIIANNSDGDSAPSNVDCTAPPQFPTNIAAAASGTPSIDVEWIDASSVEDGYEVQRALDNLVFSTIATLPANAASFHDLGIVADTRYWYRVRAKKDQGFSSFSANVFAAVASGPPSAPTIETTGAGSTVAMVTWNASQNTATIRVERSSDGLSGWTAAGSASVSSDGHRDTGRTPEQQVCHRAFAANSLGESGPSNVECVMLIAQPTNMVVGEDENGMMTWTWTDNSQQEDRYIIPISYCRVDYSYCEFTHYEWLEPNSTGFSFWWEPGFLVHGVFACGDGCSDAATPNAQPDVNPSAAIPQSALNLVRRLDPARVGRATRPGTAVPRQNSSALPPQARRPRNE